MSSGTFPPSAQALARAHDQQLRQLEQRARRVEAVIDDLRRRARDLPSAGDAMRALAGLDGELRSLRALLDRVRAQVGAPAQRPQAPPREPIGVS